MVKRKAIIAAFVIAYLDSRMLNKLQNITVGEGDNSHDTTLVASSSQVMMQTATVTIRNLQNDSAKI